MYTHETAVLIAKELTTQIFRLRTPAGGLQTGWEIASKISSIFRGCTVNFKDIAGKCEESPTEVDHACFWFTRYEQYVKVADGV